MRQRLCPVLIVLERRQAKRHAPQSCSATPTKPSSGIGWRGFQSSLSHTRQFFGGADGNTWLILSPEALTRDFLYKVYCRHYERPMWILETERCRLRELSAEDFDALLLLQKENAQNPEGCFFPDGCDNPEDFSRIISGISIRFLTLGYMQF